MNEREFEGKAAESLENETLRYPAPLWVGITGFTKVFQHPVREAVAVLRR